VTVFESVEDAIGGTPLFHLTRLAEGIAAPVYAEAEFLSVGGSVKDRAALAMTARDPARAGDPVAAHLAAPQPAVGAGQPVSAALAALGEHHRAAVVLVDGRAVALTHRDELRAAAGSGAARALAASPDARN
jgi:cysteine synthase